MRMIAMSLIWLLCGLAPAGATIVQQLSVEQMAREADVVVHGKVVKRSAAWNPQKTRIYTVTEITVIDPLKGPHAAGVTLQVRQLGGTADGITQSIVGNARFAVDEEVLLFLDHDTEKQLHYVIGMAQGKYHVERRETGPTVLRDLAGLALADLGKEGPAALKHAPHGGQPEVALDAFKARIKAALAAP